MAGYLTVKAHQGLNVLGENNHPYQGDNRKMRRISWHAAFILALLIAAPAWGDMLISPTRAILDKDNPITSLVLRNTSDGAKTYRLEWEDKRVNAAGGYEPVEKGEDWPSAADMIRFSPRQITVGPGENQAVRLNFRPPANLEPGEYRSHLKLQVVAEVSEPASVVEMQSPDQEGLAFKLFMQMSFSIPVIVRHELGQPTVKISDVKVQSAESGKSMALGVTLERSGEASSYGKLVVEMQRDGASPVELIGRKKEVYVFHETREKVVRVALRDAAIPAGSWIRVAYEGIAEYNGILWDEKVFQSK
jgi:P pilus assembly chaperone PapD